MKRAPTPVHHDEETPASSVRAIAFYLPQYHPVPENDAWWGRGFTEWTNVTKVRPQFPGHDQPHLPADLGFYDLRLPETREAQAALAREHGIHGFCYYHYWFNGRRILERPFQDTLDSGKPDFPFCLCWANENWTRRWDGADEEILLGQNYSEQDDRAHARWLATAFRDPRYIRINRRPLFLVYRASKLPCPARTVEIWREEARVAGIGEVFLCNVESFSAEQSLAGNAGFDAAVEFAPDWSALPPAQAPDRVSKLLRNHPRLLQWLAEAGLASPWRQQHQLYDYDRLVTNMLAKPQPAYRRFPCVTPAWDNSARRKSGATILVGHTPEKYGRWLAQVVQNVQPWPAEQRVVFINAWNEWAEGNHLEPCQRWGRANLEATRSALGLG